MVELPDDPAELQRRTVAAAAGGAVVYREAEQLVAALVARVRAEAVAEREAIIEVIRQYLPDALPFNTLPEIVGGIARQRDFQHELKDHLAEVARRLTDERDDALAEAVAGERQRLTALIRNAFVTDHETLLDSYWNNGLRQALLIIGAGSVPVATPERNPFLPAKPDDGQHSFQGPADLGGNSRCRFCGAYQGSVEAGRPCEGEFKESGKMRSWARRRWEDSKASGPVATPTAWHDHDCGPGMAYPHPASAHSVSAPGLAATPEHNQAAQNCTQHRPAWVIVGATCQLCPGPVAARLQPERVGFGTDAFEAGGSLPGQPVATPTEPAIPARLMSLEVPSDEEADERGVDGLLATFDVPAGNAWPAGEYSILAPASPVPAEQPSAAEQVLAARAEQALAQRVLDAHDDELGTRHGVAYRVMVADHWRLIGTFEPHRTGARAAFDRRAGEEEAGADLLGHRPTVGEAVRAEQPEPVREYGERMSGGGYSVRNLGEHVERIYPTLQWVVDLQGLGATVYTRLVRVEEDWEPVPEVAAAEQPEER